MANIVIKATWSGKFPCLCHGTWSLFVNDKEETNKIPEELIKSSMNTFGVYSRFYFDSNYLDIWEDYEDGLPEAEWIKANYSWLCKITEDEDTLKEIYRAFSKEDWREGSCGGCI